MPEKAAMEARKKKRRQEYLEQKEYRCLLSSAQCILQSAGRLISGIWGSK